MKDCRYEEALERARELHEAGNALTKSQMEIVFPELKESEDEKITAEIVDFISRNADRGDDIMKSAGWIAYLEKQKDEVQRQFNLGVQAGREEAMYEMEKEQKPAEMSDEIKIHFLKCLIQYQVRDGNYAFGHNGRDFVSKQEAIEMLSSLRPQPKQEWSEGIKKQLEEISDYLKYKGREEDADFIRHLRPQPHWKPSKEQIDTLEAVVGMIHPTDKRYDAVFGLLEELKAL